MISLVCCSRDAAEPPKAKISAATAAPPGCQPRSRKNNISPMPPANRYAKVRVGFAKARRRIERGEREMERRKDQRLRIGDLRPAGEQVRRPERRFAMCQRSGEKLQFRLELRLGIPRYGEPAGHPWPRQHHKSRAEEENRERIVPGAGTERRRARCRANYPPRDRRSTRIPSLAFPLAAPLRLQCGRHL